MTEAHDAPDPARSERPATTWPSVPPAWRPAGLVLLVLLAIAGLVWLWRIVLLFTFASLIAYLLAPLVRRMAPRLGGRRGLAVLLLYLGLGLLTLGFVGGVVPGVVSDLATLRESTPAAVAKLNEDWLPRASAWFDETFPGLLAAGDARESVERASELVVHPEPDGSYRIDLRDAHLEVHERAGGWVIEAEPEPQQSFAGLIRDIVASKGDELTEAATRIVRAILTGIAGFLTDLLITLILAALILVDLERLRRLARSLVPAELRGDVANLARGVDQGMAGAIRGQLLICLINGALAYAGLMVFDVRYALLLAMITALLSIIPVFGILISAIPLLGVALLSGDVGLEGLAFGRGAAIVSWIVGIHLLESTYLNPRVIGTADIHPVVLMFALLAGWEAWGLLGAVLALPVASVLQTVFLYVRKRGVQQHARESGVRPSPPPA